MLNNPCPKSDQKIPQRNSTRLPKVRAGSAYKPDKAETFSPEEVTSVIETASDYRLVGLFDLGFTLGPRPEELFGFQWQDWDEAGQQLSVRRKVAEINGTLEIGPPKTPASVRDLTLPTHLMDRLADRRKAALKEGRAGREDWIWSNVRGNPMRRSNIRNHIWTKLLKAAGVPYRKMYCMRHTAATTMLNGRNGVRGIPLAVVSATLGHDNPQITLEVYSHVLKTDREEVRTFWNSCIGPLTSGG
jgi:integrase